MVHSGDSSPVNNTMHKQFHLCSFLGLSCESKKRIHKYLQITECCLWESHSLRTTEDTGLSKKKKNNKKITASNTTVQITFHLHGHGMARGVMVIGRISGS